MWCTVPAPISSQKALYLSLYLSFYLYLYICSYTCLVIVSVVFLLCIFFSDFFSVCIFSVIKHHFSRGLANFYSILYNCSKIPALDNSGLCSRNLSLNPESASRILTCSTETKQEVCLLRT